MRRILAVGLERQTYLGLAYLLVRLPLWLAFPVVGALIVRLGVLNPISFLLLVAAVVFVWPLVRIERALASTWFGVQLTPLGPERPPGRRWQRRVADLVTNAVTWKSLAYALIETVIGSIVGVLILAALIIGTLGTVALVITSLMSGLVGLVNAAPVPSLLPLRTLGGAIVCAGIFLLTLHLSRWLTRLQLRFVRAMLGMSETQFALTTARAEAASAQARAEAADRSRHDLVLSVSHELRNPLATIRAHVDTLRAEETQEPPPEERKRYLEVVHRETDRLSSLVDELLTLASADTGSLQLDLGPVNPAEVAREVHEAMAPLASQERRIQLLCQTDGTLSVTADRRRLVQVLMNLVRNAITHTPDGGLVAIEVKPGDAGHVELSVSDTGVGIEPEELDRIFERFYRTDASRSRATGGFGLGLAIAREMVDAMGGRLRVESLPGQGSRFTVTLAQA